jgi:hypothetical protein
MVVSTSHLDPIDAFAKLVQQQNLQQQQSPVKLPKWFMANIYKYFVLLHDVTEGEESKYVTSDLLIEYQCIRLRLYIYTFLSVFHCESKICLVGILISGLNGLSFILIILKVNPEKVYCRVLL